MALTQGNSCILGQGPFNKARGVHKAAALDGSVRDAAHHFQMHVHVHQGDPKTTL